MLSEKITNIEKSIKDLKELKEKADQLMNERKMKFAMVGVNEIIKTVAELMILEKVLDNINEIIEIDGEGFEILSKEAIKNEIPGATEMLDYISLRYRDSMSDECQIIKRFIDEFKYQEVTKKLFD